MQIQTIRKDSKHSNANSNHLKCTFECKLETFERDSKRSNANSDPTKGILSIRMQIRTIWKGFEAFECKFEPIERDSKRSNANSNHSKGILSVRIQIRTIPVIRSIRMQIWTIRNGFEVLECKFEPFERDSKNANANSNHSKGIWIVQMQIRAIRKGFEAIECKF